MILFAGGWNWHSFCSALSLAMDGIDVNFVVQLSLLCGCNKGSSVYTKTMIVLKRLHIRQERINDSIFASD